MKSPIKDTRYNNYSLSQLKKLIPKKAIVSTYGLYAANIEISLSLHGINVNAFTNKPVIYQFWHCLFHNNQRLYSILTNKAFKFKGITEYNLLQERLPTYKDAYIRSSLFFMLNRCSATGQVSCGEFNTGGYNALSLNYLRTFKKPDGLNVYFYDNYHDKMDEGEFVIFHSLNFSYNIANIGSHESYDSYNFNNRKLKDFLSLGQKKKTVLIYNHHPGLLKFYKDFNLTLINRYGVQTDNIQNCEEIIVTNF